MMRSLSLRPLLALMCLCAAAVAAALRPMAPPPRVLPLAAPTAWVTALAAAPHPAFAISDSARDALALLDGYQSVAPPSVTWTVLITGGVWLYFKIFKIMASA